jgi:hypothetical protein
MLLAAPKLIQLYEKTNASIFPKESSRPPQTAKKQSILAVVAVRNTKLNTKMSWPIYRARTTLIYRSGYRAVGSRFNVSQAYSD